MSQSLLRELAHTSRSLLNATYDWILLRVPLSRLAHGKRTFAFLVHPRTDDFIGSDVYGINDIYRPFPALRHLYKVLPEPRATAVIQWFARTIVPITLSRIRVRMNDMTVDGFLLSTVRTPRLLFSGRGNTGEHLKELFMLAKYRGVKRVGLGALLPSLTRYGQRFVTGVSNERPGISTGHAYTGYQIVEYLKFLVTRRHEGIPRVKIAIAGAAGSTGKAVMRVLKRTWTESTQIDLVLVDVAKKQSALSACASEAEKSGTFASVSTATSLDALRSAEYIVVVTADALIQPQHLRPGSVVIDDSQPRNTSPELVTHGCKVVDVLAKVPGLDCGFSFGFDTADPTVTFTCLAETILATVAGDLHDLAVGEVTDAVVVRTLEIVEIGRKLGLIGDLPLYSFGRELTEAECLQLLSPLSTPVTRVAAE